jgi:cation diffusion facilitator CzcD-associated flavoprotein CzcO
LQAILFTRLGGITTIPARIWNHLKDKVVGIIGTGASAVQIVPELAKVAKEVFVFQRTPSSIDIRDDWPTDPNWARKLQPGWQNKRREKVLAAVENSLEKRAAKGATSPEEKLRKAGKRQYRLHDAYPQTHR